MFFVDQIYGRRLTIDTNFNATQISVPNDYNTYKAYLRLDDSALLTFTSVGETPKGHPHVTVALTADHPYAASTSGGTPDGSTWMRRLKDRRAGDADLHRPWLGRHGEHTVQQMVGRGRGRFGNAVPRWPLMPSSTVCQRIYSQPTGRFAREKAGASYLAQYTRAAHLHAALINGVAQLHHVIGIAYSDDSVGDNSPGGDKDYIPPTTIRISISIPGSSLTSKTSHNRQSKRRAALACAGGDRCDHRRLDAGAAARHAGHSIHRITLRVGQCALHRTGEDPSSGGPRKFLQFDSTNSGSVTSCTTPGCGVICGKTKHAAGAERHRSHGKSAELGH